MADPVRTLARTCAKNRCAFRSSFLEINIRARSAYSAGHGLRGGNDGVSQRRGFVADRVTMVLMSVLNNTLNSIVNAERRGKRQVLVRPTSKVVIKFLTVMMKHGSEHRRRMFA